MRSLYRLAPASLAMLGALICAAPSASAAPDEFLGTELGSAWEVHSPGNAEFVVEDGWLHVDVPGAHWLGMQLGEAKLAPMFLVDPPAGAATITFETRLRFDSRGRSPQFASAGLVLVGRDLDAGVLLKAVRVRRWIGYEWWWGGRAQGSGGPEAFQLGEDMWLRFEHRGDHFVASRKQREEDPWEDITDQMGDGLSNIYHRFPADTFRVGVFVTSGVAPDDDVAVSFDYFSSPQISALAVEAAGKAATAWGALKQAAR
jgi:hypothetical protein